MNRVLIGVRVFFDVILAAIIGLVLCGLVLGRVVPLTGRQTLVIAGRSMAPAIPIGAAVVIESVPADRLAVGDVVSIRTPSGIVFSHRISRIVERPDGRWLETRGDANAAPDPSLTPVAWVLGRVALSLPIAGYLVELLSLPTGLLFVAGLAATSLVGLSLVDELEREAPAAPLPVSPDGPDWLPERVAREPDATA